MKEVTIGDGKYAIGECERDGVIGISIAKLDKPHPIGEVPPGHKKGMEVAQDRDGVFIWLSGIDGATVLLGELTGAIATLWAKLATKNDILKREGKG